MSLSISTEYAPMEAQPAEELPEGRDWHYEPKWDGFRCLAFRDGNRVTLQSKSGKPLTRYFPELVTTILSARAKQFVLDGEIVIPVGGNLSFDDLLARIHPAASRIAKLSQETPCVFIVFDLLVDAQGKKLVQLPLRARRRALESFARQVLKDAPRVQLSPATKDISTARKWFHMGVGLDGIVAKRDDLPYQTGKRSGVQKIKKQRTADCVVGGFRYLEKKRLAGSLLLGLYDEQGQTQSCRLHLLDSRRRSSRTHEKSASVDSPARLHRQVPGWPESLEHQTLHGLGAARSQTRCGSAI
jgi:ATP-dependent DNA ligase